MDLKKKGSNDIQDTVKASGLTLALISALTTRYTSTWMLYKPGDQVRNETRQFDEFGSYQLKIGNPNRFVKCHTFLKRNHSVVHCQDKLSVLSDLGLTQKTITVIILPISD